MRGPWSYLVLLGFLVGGCNRIDYAYPWADWLILAKIDSYFSLSEPQKTWLKPVIAQELLWHKTHELPRYVDFISHVSQAVQRGLTSEKLQGIFQQWARLRESLLNKLTGVSAEFLLQTTEAQRLRLKSKLAEENRQLSEQQKLPEQERRSRRKKWLKKRLEDWIGPLRQEQERTLSLYINNLELQDAPWLARRIVGQHYFFSRLPDSTKLSLQILLTELWLTAHQSNPTEADRLRAVELKKTEMLLLGLYKQMSKQQKETLQTNLEALKSTLVRWQQ